MIIATNSASAALRKVKSLKSNQVTQQTLDRILDQLAIDPQLAKPSREAYVFTSDDIKTQRDIPKIEQAITNKHPNTVIVFVNKETKQNKLEGVEGIDKFLNKPNPDEIQKAFEQILAGKEADEKFVRKPGTTLDKIYNQTDNSNVNYKMERRSARPNRNKKEEEKKSVTGNPIKTAPGSVILITASAEDPTTFYSVNTAGEYHPVYPNGDPIPVDEYGNVMDDRIEIDENGYIMCDENNVVILREGIPSTFDNPEFAADSSAPDAVLGNNVNNLKGYDEVEEESNKNPDEGDDMVQMLENRDLVPSKPDKINTDTSSNILNRIGNASEVSDIQILLREMQVSDVVKDLIRSNSTYSGIEEKLKSMEDAIYAIMHDKSGTPLEERYSKIRAIMHDKAFYNASGNTLIEQLTVQIIDLIVSKSSELINERIEQIDKSIKRSAESGWQQDKPALIAGLADERASLSVELYKLQSEIKELMTNTDVLISNINNEIALRATGITNNEDVDLWLTAKGVNPVDGASVEAIRQLLLKASEIPAKYKELEVKINAQQGTIRKVFQIEDEIAEAQKTILERMQSRTLEDKVICQTLLKKSLNIFVGTDNVGKTIIPYLYTKTKSKQNCNILLVNISKNNKFGSYGIKTVDYDNFVTDMVLQEFTVVTGNIADDVAAAQQFMSVMLRAVDYYKYIYIVMDADQTSLFNTIAPDVYSVNYIVDTNPTNLDATRKFIDSAKLDNVLERIFINRCNIGIKPILQKLGKLETIDYQICKVEDIPEITDGSLTGYDPYGISSVSACMEDLTRHIKYEIDVMK